MKKIIFSLLLLTAQAAWSGSVCKALLSGSTGSEDVVACYDYNSRAEAILPDKSRNNHHGAMNGTIPWIPGIDSMSFGFDSYNDYVAIGSLGYSPVDSSNMSVSFWFQTAESKEQTALYYVTAPYEMEMTLVNGNIRVTWSTSGLQQVRQVKVTTDKLQLADAHWNHVVLVKQDTSYKIFVNNVEALVKKEIGFGQIVPNRPNRGLYLANTPWGVEGNSSKWFNGKLDETVILKKALSALEVQLIYQASLNNVPTITSVPDTVTDEDAPYTYVVVVKDLDGDPISLNLVTKPPGMILSGDTVKWTPPQQAVGANTVSIRASDGKGGIVNQTYALKVMNVNDAPNINSVPPTEATENLYYWYQVQVIDPDPGETLTFTLLQNPAGMTVSPSGKISWTPNSSQLGANQVSIEVKDVAGAKDTQTYTLTVSSVNTKPTIHTTSLEPATEDMPYTETLEASDNESTNLTWSLLSGPSGMTINSDSGILVFTPVDSQYGTKTVRVAVSDGVLSDTAEFSLVVNRVNDPPVISDSLPDAKVYETDSTYRIYLPAFDEEGDSLTWSLIKGPTGASIVGDTLVWQPDSTDLGLDNMIFRVTDGVGSDTLDQLYLVVQGATGLAFRVQINNWLQLHPLGWTLYVDKKSSGALFTLYSLQGRQVYRQRFKAGIHRLDFFKIPAGQMYLAVLKTTSLVQKMKIRLSEN